MVNHPLLPFFLNNGPDHVGRTLLDYRGFTHRQMEKNHDYIQWMFPTWVKSHHNHQAPVLDEDVHAALNASPLARQQLMESFIQMLEFYGLQLNENRAVVPSPSFSDRSLIWRCRNNHNHLRLTRILLSLYTLGLEDMSVALGRCILGSGLGKVNDKTIAIWKDACRL